jgi:Acetoacetate decarboxylase (ADC)
MDRSAFFKAVDTVGGGRARDAFPPVRHVVPSAQSIVMADPDDLVARALAILAADNTMSDKPQFPQGVNIARDFGTPSGDLTLQRRVLSDGTECPLPIRYFDVQCLVATFLTELDRAAELLMGTGLQAVPQEDGKAVVVLYFIEYRKTDLGPYNEVGLTVLAAAPGDPIPASYVLNLPVTTEAATRAGREIWGYNKFVTPIDVSSDGKKFLTILRDPENEMIGTLEGRRGPSIPAPPNDILTFTLLGGRVIKTLIRVLTPFHASSGDSFVFKVGTSRHPMAKNLRTLTLDGARPVLVQYADPFQALLFPGRAV